MTLLQRFLVLFLVCLSLQAYLWKHTIVIDLNPWSHAAAAMKSWDTETLHNPFTYGYPGAPLLVLAATAMQLAQVPPSIAYVGSLIVLISLATAVTGLISWRLRPNQILWLVIPAIIVLNPLLTNATPPSALVAVVLALTMMFLLRLEANSRVSLKSGIILGGLLGIAAAIRVDAALLFTAFLIPYTAFRFSSRFALLTLLAAGTSFIIFNPFMWFEPIQFLQGFWDKAAYHAVEKEILSIRLSSLLQYGVFGFIGMTLTVISLLLPRPALLPRSFVWVGVAITAAIALELSVIHHKALWYMLPVILFWELMTPLLLLDLTQYFSPPKQWQYRISLPSAARAVIVFVLIGGSAALYIQHLTKPHVVYALP